ncbi:hypothetical protein SteCoe_3121 [Stentor coeruleus]|uniref:EF-hand domain-containing protein n=1 Tax=Stentor coeruleus TaxID=5963 RepID=A0A1R2CXR4_9CILI|nr:hypothetical protein SteCoe_3121 [Stentor coeruleus]
MSGYEDERKIYSKSPVNRISKETSLGNYNRPFTAKKLEIERNQTFKKYLGRNNSGTKGKKIIQKDKSPLAAKPKPNRIVIDKERLYIENMELKLKNHELSENLINCKSKLIKLEREKQKRSEGILLENPLEKSTDSKAVNLLKIIEDSHKEIQKLKDKSKNEKNSRFKTDKNHYKKENSDKQYHEIECLKFEMIEKDKKHLIELERFKKDFEEEKKKSRRIVDKLNKANELIESLYKELKMIRTKKPSKFLPPKCLSILRDLAQSYNKSVSGYLKTFDSSNSKKISTSQLLYSLKVHDSTITSSDMDLIINYIKGSDPSTISIKKLLNYFNTFDFTLETYPNNLNEIDTLLQHLCLRMQLHRVPKENLINALLGAESLNNKSIHSQEIILLFTNTPFNFSRKEAIKIAEFLFQGVKTMKYEEFVEKFYKSVDDWEVFTPKDEESFDAYLLNLVAISEPNLQKACEDRDEESKGIISLEDFKIALSESKIELPVRVEGYLQVLFYSHNMELGVVPYRQFFQAYSSTEEQIQEDKKENIPQKYLELIGKSLTLKNRTVRNTFVYDSNGIILAEDFIQGLKTLGFEDIPKDNLIEVLEALQGNPEERVVCVHVNDLEDVMEGYGVPIDYSEKGTFRSEAESLTGTQEGHVQKISLLDSLQIDNMDFTETGPMYLESQSTPPTTSNKSIHRSSTYNNL